MKERLLSLSLTGVIEAFRAVHWKFFEEDEELGLIRAEVPLGFGEAFVVELHYEDPEERERIVDELLGADFIQQTTRITSDF